MPITLRVTNQAVDASEPAEYHFEDDRITIGRGSDNRLTLPDAKRVVSTRHAELRRSEGSYELVDLGSKNFTYLDGERLDPDRPYPIESGDTFRIGEFEIEFVAREAPEPEVARTVFAADFTNPFEAPAAQLLEALEEIADAYEGEAPSRREDALQDAFRHASEELGHHDATRAVARLLGLDAGAKAPADQATRAPEAPADAPPSDASTPDASRPSRPSTTAPVAPSEAIGAVLDALVEAVARLVGIPWRFRHEFIGQTIMQSADTAFLYEGDPDTIKRHLLDPSLSDAERAERIDRVREAAEAVVIHQVAMLNGYKASVMQGAQELLEAVNPEAIEAEVAEQNKLFELLPWLASPVVVERLQAQWNELQAGDRSVAEQRIFRPAFIKAYLARMTAVRSAEQDTR